MSVGTKQLTADGYLASTAPTRLYSVVIKSGGTAATVAFKNANTTEYLTITGTINLAVEKNYEGGLMFPGGCYVDIDANTTYVTANFETEGT